MKTIQSRIWSITAILLASTSLGLAAPVTFQVNMELRRDFDPSLHTVEVRGAFDGWGPGVTMSQSLTNTDVFEATIDIAGAPGISVEYKFVMNLGFGLIVEGNVGVGGAPNRSLTLTDAAQTLPVVLFNRQSVAGTSTPVTFQVNMEVQRALGVFDPAAHTVEVHGAFDGWGPGVALAQSAGNTNVYEGTVNIPGSSGQVEYKFVLNQAGTLVWEGNVGAGGAANRSLTLTGSAQTLPVVYFNNQAAPPGVVAVTFQVNMGVQATIGNFDPAAHTVEARGAFDNWGAGITLAPSATDTNIFVGTANVTGTPGMVFEHKFVINQAGTLVYEGNVGPGGPFGNRVFTLASPPDQILPAVYFNNFTNAVTAIPVTFRVNMGVQIARGTFDPASGVVNLAGPFNNWSTSATVLTNSPTDPFVYQGTVNISGVSPGGTVPFKFVANSGTWETGNDRTFVLASSAQTLPIEYFDRVPDLGRLNVTHNPTPFDVEITLTWTGAPQIRVQTGTSLTGPWEEVPNTLGASTITLMYDETPGPRFFRLVGP